MEKQKTKMVDYKSALKKVEFQAWADAKCG